MADSDQFSVHKPVQPPPPPPHLASSTFSFQEQKPDRRVSFSNYRSTSTYSYTDPEELKPTFPNYDEDEEESIRSRRYMCYAWLLLGLLAFSILVLIVSLLFVSMLRSGLPQVDVLRLNFPEPTVNKQNTTLLKADCRVEIQLFNINDNLKLHYSPLTVDVLSENIELGHVTIPRFYQKPKNKKVLKVNTQVRKSAVNEDDVRALKANAASHQIVLNMILTGKMRFQFGLIDVKWVPVLITCQNVRQADLDLAMKHQCKVKIFTFKT